jgi:hypothetical protein
MTYRDRIEIIIQLLIDTLDRADGDVDLEVEHHDGEPLFPGHPNYAMRPEGNDEAGPGVPEDAEEEPDTEDDDPDEGSYIFVTSQSGRIRIA